MLNVPDSIKALYKADGIRKNFRAHFPGGELPDVTNENIVQESVHFTESVCSQDVFKFGLSEASVIEFECVGVGNMYGLTVECSSEVDCSSLTAEEVAEIEAGEWDGEYVALADSDLGFPFFRVPYGVFRVESCPRDHQVMTHRRVTAYTKQFADGDSFPGLPTVIPWSAINIDAAALYSYMLDKNVTELFEAEYEQLPFWQHFIQMYDSQGVEYRISRFAGANLSEGASFYRDTVYASNIYGRTEPVSFVKFEADYTREKNDAFGVAVATALDDAGLDLTYNQSGVKKFRTNEEALRWIYPPLFSPCISYGMGQYYFFQPADYNVLTPVIMPKISGKDSAFTAKSKKDFYVDCIQGHGVTVTEGHLLIIIAPPNSDSYTMLLPLPTQNWPPLRPKLVCYGLQGYGDKMTVEESGELRVYTQSYTWPYGDGKKIKMYSFADTFKVLEMFNSSLELGASFVSPDRNGSYIEKRLSADSPEAVTPGEYSQMWFDEYDVESIGTIRYAFTDDAGEEQVADYQFGPGTSVYDMSDNVVLKALSGASTSTIEAMLDRDFIPYLGGVNFTPVDLQMKGYPYVEAGDSIIVTAQDGTECRSYVLRQKQSGVQVISTQVDSQSGLIIDSEEGGT